MFKIAAEEGSSSYFIYGELAEAYAEIGDAENAETYNAMFKRAEDAGSSKAQGSLLFVWLWPVTFGIVFGAIALAPLVRGPGDPSGHVIGTGLGGIVGLGATVVWRMLASRRRSKRST